MDKLKFLVSGIPLTAFPYETIAGIKRVSELGLGGMELEWVQQVPFGEDKAQRIAETAKKLKVALTVHGSYYINLASYNSVIWHASITRIEKAARIGALCGAVKLTFHGGFYQKLSKGAAASQVREGLRRIKDELEQKKVNIIIAPETTGKPTQFGDLAELVALAKELNIGFCLDFSHLHARTNGEYNSPEEFEKMFQLISKKLGPKFLKNMYFHLSGILYSEKGERRHVCLLESPEDYVRAGIKIEKWREEKLRPVDYVRGGPDIKWREIIQALKAHKIGGHIVIESPCMERDALLVQNYYNSL